MSHFKVGYFVGSLATASINRLLAKALVRLAPRELAMVEIPYKDLPREKIKLPTRQKAEGYREPNYPYKFITERF